MSTYNGYTQGAILTFGHHYENAVYPVTVDILGTDGDTVSCRHWLPVGTSFAPQSVYMDVVFGRRRRIYRPAADALDGTPRAVALDFDYATRTLALTSVRSVTARTENGRTVGVIA